MKKTEKGLFDDSSSSIYEETKFCFGNRVEILKGFLKGNIGYIIGFNKQEHNREIGIPPNIQIVKELLTIYTVRCFYFQKGNYTESKDFYIPETLLKKR